MFYGNELVKDYFQVIYIDLTKTSFFDYEEFELKSYNNYRDYLYLSEFFVETNCYDKYNAHSGFAHYEIWYMGNFIGLAERYWGDNQGPGYDEVGIYWF